MQHVIVAHHQERAVLEEIIGSSAKYGMIHWPNTPGPLPQKFRFRYMWCRDKVDKQLGKRALGRAKHYWDPTNDHIESIHSGAKQQWIDQIERTIKQVAEDQDDLNRMRTKFDGQLDQLGFNT